MSDVIRKLAWLLGAAAFIAASVLLAAWIGRPKPTELVDTGKAGEAKRYRIEPILEHIQAFSASPSRVTGYPGCEEAADYILARLREYGVEERNIAIQPFDVPSPIVESAFLEIDGAETIPLHPLWPNLARASQTAPEGLEGLLVDIGAGNDAGLEGKPIRDSIVVMDWDSHAEWLSVPEFGGKAVLFRGAATSASAGAMARAKFLTVPADIPRFFVAPEDAPALDRALKREAPRATVYCKMAWRLAESKNILARVSGGDRTDDGDNERDAVVFHAYYDSVSVAPGLSPGAEQAAGAAALLELARYFAGMERQPERPVFVLFTGGHGQAFAGMTRFTRALRDGLRQGWPPESAPTLMARMGRPGLFVGLDLSSHSGRLGLFCVGAFRGQSEAKLRPKFSVLGLKLVEYAKSFNARTDDVDQLSFVDCINLTGGRGWWTYFPYIAGFESELPALAGFPAVTLATVNDERRFVDTPDDTFDRMRADLLAEQIIMAPDERLGLANIASALAFWKGLYVSSHLSDYLARLSGRVVWLDQQKSYTPDEPLRNAMVFMKMARGDKYMLGTRGLPARMTDENGLFEFDGLIDATGNAYFLNPNSCTLEAYGAADSHFLEANAAARAEYLRVRSPAASSLPAQSENASSAIPLDGSILYAIDNARQKEYPWKIAIRGKDQSVNLVAFPCRSVTLYGLTDPRGYIPLKDAQILEVATRSPPFQYGASSTDSSLGDLEENCISIWAEPSLRVYMTFGFGFMKKRLILINNDAQDAAGKGFALAELAGVPSMALQGAMDMWNINEWRIGRLEAQGIGNPRVKKLHEEARLRLDEAAASLANLDYRGYRASSEKGWALEGKAYAELLSMTNNMIRGVMFYLALLLPFAYCLERLLIAAGTIRNRILGMAGIFALAFAILAVAHPAFRFTLTPFIVLLAFLILALAATVSLLIVGKFDAMLRERKQDLTGLHEDTQSRAGVAARAIDLGIANIRRRPQRGLLTGMTIVLVTFTMLSFTSIVPETSISRLRHPNGMPVRKGLLARDRAWAPLPAPLSASMDRAFQTPAGEYPIGVGAPSEDSRIEEMHLAEGSTVAARAWFYSDKIGSLSQIDLIAVDPPSQAAEEDAAAAEDQPAGRFTAVSLLCMEPQEPAVSAADRALTAGRWFRDINELGIILPDHIAHILGYGPDDLGKRVLVFGMELPLLGIYEGARFDAIRDIDGEPLTPVDFVAQSQMMADRSPDQAKADTLEEYAHYSSDQIAIVPLRFGRRLGATYRAIAIQTPPGVDAGEEASGYALRSNQTVLACDGNDVTLFAALDTASFAGVGQIGVPILLGFIMVLGTMLGSVYERRREIFVYNSVGLSPTDVSSLFLAESSVYAVIGACLGYILGQVISKAILASGSLGELSLNYSAGAAVFVALLTMSIVLLSTLYPARQAFLSAIPESRRGERESDALAGAGEDSAFERIAFYLPFVATPSSIFGMQAYMHEFLQSVEGVSVGQLAVDDLRAECGEANGKPSPSVRFRAWLAPFDLGISHDADLRIVYREERGVYQFHLTAERASGDQRNWRRLTPRFILTLRKQLLMWRILSDEERHKYMERGERLFGQSIQHAS